jgi:hypothetical protein
MCVCVWGGDRRGGEVVGGGIGWQGRGGEEVARERGNEQWNVNSGFVCVLGGALWLDVHK